MFKKYFKNSHLPALIVISCLILSIVPQVSDAQTTSPIKITEVTCDKTVLAPGENATVRIYIKNVGHERLNVWGQLDPTPNASYSIDVLVGFGILNGDTDFLYYMEFYITNTGEYSKDTEVTVKASVSGAHIEGSYSMNATELAAIPELTSENFTITFLKNDAIPLDSKSTEASLSYLWILIIVAVIVVICIVLFAYKRKKKQKTEAKPSQN